MAAAFSLVNIMIPQGTDGADDYNRAAGVLPAENSLGDAAFCLKVRLEARFSLFHETLRQVIPVDELSHGNYQCHYV